MRQTGCKIQDVFHCFLTNVNLELNLFCTKGYNLNMLFKRGFSALHRWPVIVISIFIVTSIRAGIYLTCACKAAFCIIWRTSLIEGLQADAEIVTAVARTVRKRVSSFRGDMYLLCVVMLSNKLSTAELHFTFDYIVGFTSLLIRYVYSLQFDIKHEYNKKHFIEKKNA